jgi:alanyl-tRNA synthetase
LLAAHQDFATLGEAARLLSCGPPEVPSILGKALDERKQAQRARQMLLEQLAAHEAREILRETTGADAAATRVVTHIFENAEPAYLRMVATRLVSEPGVQALLATRSASQSAGKAVGHVVFAQSPGLAADMNALLGVCVQCAGGKGGGTRDFAQGSVPTTDHLEDLLQTAKFKL